MNAQRQRADAASPESGDGPAGRDFDVFRLRLGDAIALLAAFSLLFIMAGDWYSTSTGVRARELERQGVGSPASQVTQEGRLDSGAVEDLRVEAEQSERNAWQIASAFDLLVLLGLLAAFGATVVAAALRAAGRQSADPRRSPMALAGYAALVALVLVVIQAALRLDPDSDAQIVIGLPLGVGALGALAFGAGLSLRQERLAAGGEPPATAASDAAPRAGGAGAGRAYNRAP